MRRGTLTLFYFVKFAELLFLTILTVLIWVSGCRFIFQNGDPEDTVTMILILVCMVCALYNLLYNNLLTNLRFKTKVDCNTFGMCTYDCINITICYCIFKKICKDQCFTPFTIGKWIVTSIIFGITLYFVDAQAKDLEELGISSRNHENLLKYLMIYALQHPIFMVARLPIFFIYALATCCCDKGQEYGDNEEFNDLIISYKYIETLEDERNHFVNHQVGRAEINFNHSLNEVRQRRITLANEATFANQMANASRVDKMRASMRKTIGQAMTLSMRDSTCVICTIEFEAPCTISELACHKKHILHEECLSDWLKHNEQKGSEALCPICRAKIEKDKIVKKNLIKSVEQSPDPFSGLAVQRSNSMIQKANQLEDIVVIAPEGAPPMSQVEMNAVHQVQQMPQLQQMPLQQPQFLPPINDGSQLASIVENQAENIREPVVEAIANVDIQNAVPVVEAIANVDIQSAVPRDYSF